MKNTRDAMGYLELQAYSATTEIFVDECIHLGLFARGKWVYLAA
jgi:hypothetical protein